MWKIIISSHAIFFLLIYLSAYASSGNSHSDSFNKVKKILERQVYFDHRTTIYCSAKFDDQGYIELPDGVTIIKYQNRTQKIEWEHAVPAETFGHTFSEWQDGHPECVSRRGKAFKGRRCVEKVNAEYRYMQADMYNLFPAIGSVNAVRSNKRYSELPGSDPKFGSCMAKVDGNRFEPPDRAKGPVARAALYMADSYPKYNLSRQQKQLFKAWDKMFPISEWECRQVKRIETIQGNTNRFVKKPCRKSGLW